VQQIRETFAGRASADRARSLEPVLEDELVASGHVTRGALRKLEQMGVLSPRTANGRRTYSADDAAVVRHLARLRETGLTPERGFDVAQVRIYQEAAERLAEEELRFALEGVVGRIEPGKLQSVAGVWMDAADEILRILHRKAVRRRLRELRTGMAESREGAHPRSREGAHDRS
jgi:DNA-binding transcriptional MerR regulator